MAVPYDRRFAPTPTVLLALLALAGCGGGSEPRVPSGIALAPLAITFTAVGQTQQLSAAITDQSGDPVDDAAVTWDSSEDGVATVSATGLVEATGVGTAQITATVGSLAAIATVAVTQSIANFEGVSGDGQGGLAGQPLAQPLVVEASDELGNPVQGLIVEFAVTAGGGSVEPASTSTGLDGRASTVFTLGAPAGSVQQVTASLPGTDRVVTFSASATQPVPSLISVAGNTQSASAGTPVPAPPAVRVTDAAGQPVAGTTVQFAVTEGGGSVTGATVSTNSSGIATVGSWSLGASGVNTLTATAPGAGLAGDPVLFVATVRPAAGYDINLRYLSPPTSGQVLAFARAEIRWESIVTGDVPNLQANAAAGSCGEDSPALSEMIDDLLLFVSLEPIDGVGSTLGAAGPCFIRVPGNLSVVGRMLFDTDDLEMLEQGGALQDVILHEMGHVLGIGTLWPQFDLLADPALANPPGIDPHFTGSMAIAAFNAAGGNTYIGGKVPVENQDTVGTADSHWRETVLGNELMTGFVAQAGNPLSAITVRSLADMGYVVSVDRADPYILGAALRATGSGRRWRLDNDIMRGPIYRVDRTGNVVGVVNP